MTTAASNILPGALVSPVGHAGGVMAGGGHLYGDAVGFYGEDSIGDVVAGFASDEHAANQLALSYRFLERQRPDVALLARFARRVEFATFNMCIAFEQAGIHDFYVDVRQQRRSAQSTWFAVLAAATFSRFETLRRALTYEWTPPVEVEPLTYSAFQSLCDLTPASVQLKRLFLSRRPRAIEALVSQLDLVAKQLQDTVALASDADLAINDQSASEDAVRLASSQAEILAKAGEPLGLRQAADRLGMSHQNLHKRIDSGSALGVMRGRLLVVPSVQFVGEGQAEKVVPSLKQVLKVFEEAEAGRWSALQFLVEIDPLLGTHPMAALKAGDVDDVVHAARSYLGLDES